MTPPKMTQIGNFPYVKLLQNKPKMQLAMRLQKHLALTPIPATYAYVCSMQQCVAKPETSASRRFLRPRQPPASHAAQAQAVRSANTPTRSHMVPGARLALLLGVTQVGVGGGSAGAAAAVPATVHQLSEHSWNREASAVPTCLAPPSRPPHPPARHTLKTLIAQVMLDDSWSSWVVLFSDGRNKPRRWHKIVANLQGAVQLGLVNTTDPAAAAWATKLGNPVNSGTNAIGIWYPDTRADAPARRAVRWLQGKHTQQPRAVARAVRETAVAFVNTLERWPEFETWAAGRPRLPRLLLFSDEDEAPLCAAASGTAADTDDATAAAAATLSDWRRQLHS
jgi:hypothetical protein